MPKDNAPKGKPGTGACICKLPPEETLPRWARDLPEAEQKGNRTNACIDHRCTKHGEKAQPALWGRHRELELVVTWEIWKSLGVTYEEET